MKNTTHNHRSNGHNGALHGNGSKAESNGTAALSEPLRFVPVDSPNETNNPGGVIVSSSELLALETPNHVDEYGPSFVEAYASTEIVTGEPEQYEKIEKAVHALLDAFNVNWEDPNYTDTPKRVAKAYMDYWANGYARDAEDGDTSDPVLSRLAEATQRGEQVSLEEIELELPFMERVVVPMIKRLGELSARFTPEKQIQDTALKLELAGNPGRIDATTFLATRFVVAVVFGGLMTLIGNLPTVSWPTGRVILVVLVVTAIGFFFPQLWLSSKISRRQNEVRKALPDALDLLTICVEAGLGFEAAMSKVADKWENELSLLFGRCIREIQLGKTQREGLRDMADRIGLPELTSFVAAVIQSQLLGVSMAKVLRIQSDQMRMKRRQRAEEEAHQAPVKMIIPMALLTFPAIMIILMAPAGFQIAGAFAPFIGN